MNPDNAKKCLFEVLDVLGRSKMRPVMLQGTALGFHRESDFIANDKDIDMGVLIEDLRPMRILHGLVDLGYDVECFTMPFKVPHFIVGYKRFDAEVIKVDICGLIKHKKERFGCAPIRDHVNPHYCIVHPAMVMEIPTAIDLFGRTIYLPHNVEQYLENEYGPAWRVPSSDHISLTRRYNYLEQEGISNAYLD